MAAVVERNSLTILQVWQTGSVSRQVDKCLSFVLCVGGRSPVQDQPSLRTCTGGDCSMLVTPAHCLFAAADAAAQHSLASAASGSMLSLKDRLQVASSSSFGSMQQLFVLLQSLVACKEIQGFVHQQGWCAFHSLHRLCSAAAAGMLCHAEPNMVAGDGCSMHRSAGLVRLWAWSVLV